MIVVLDSSNYERGTLTPVMSKNGSPYSQSLLSQLTAVLATLEQLEYKAAIATRSGEDVPTSNGRILISSKRISDVRPRDYVAMVVLRPGNSSPPSSPSSSSSPLPSSPPLSAPLPPPPPLPSVASTRTSGDDDLAVMISQFWEAGKILVAVDDAIVTLLPVQLSTVTRGSSNATNKHLLLQGKSVALAPSCASSLTSALREAGTSSIRVGKTPVVHGRLITGPTFSAIPLTIRYMSKALAFANH